VRRISLSLAALLVLACDASSKPEDSAARNAAVTGSPESLTYAPELKVDLSAMTKQPSGLYIQDITTGTGAEAASGKQVSVHYTGTLADGREFDSSRGRGQPIDFKLGVGQVIQGWDEGVAGMKVGGRRKLVIPPELGYGARGAGGAIPPNATLVFDVELMGVR
jgi:FKBP-type peptidyl-prolyl cis-trans isomerase